MAIVQKINSSLPIRNGSAVTTFGRTALKQSGSFDINLMNFREYDSSAVRITNLQISGSSEYRYDIPNGTTYLQFQSRDNALVRWAFESGKAFYSQNPHSTLKTGQVFSLTYPQNGSFDEYVYFTSPVVTNVEIISQIGYKE